MAEQPILFSGPMVRAILAGRKTQTRRVVKLPEVMPPVVGWAPNGGSWKGVGRTPAVERQFISTWPMNVRCPYGVPGDRLWVRETWAPSRALDDVPTMRLASGFPCEYRAGGTSIDGLERLVERGGWRPSIFMPRHACRMLLEITEVRVERVQGISEADAIAEGVEPVHCEPESLLFNTYKARYRYRDGFKKLWDTINGKRAPWASNPWVWVVGFKRVEVRNEDH